MVHGTWYNVMVDVRGLDPGFAPSSRVSSLSFMAYSASEITGMSVKKITNPETFDSLLHPNHGGLYDPALGPTDKQDMCGTCGLNYVHCPGHMGHIVLPLPVYHPIFFTTLYQLLRATCWSCHRLLATPIKLTLMRGRLALLEAGKLVEAASLETNVSGILGGSGEGQSADSYIQAVLEVVSDGLKDKDFIIESSRNVIEAKRLELQEFLRQCSRGQSSCPHCQAPARSLRQDNHIKIFLKGLSKKQAAQWHSVVMKNADNIQSTEKQDVTQQIYVSPVEVKVHIQQVWEQEKGLLQSMFAGAKRKDGIIDLFFLTVLPVPPSRFRPVSHNMLSIIILYVYT